MNVEITPTDKVQKSDTDVGKGEAFNYDDILEHLGQKGKFQLHAFLWLCIPMFFPGIVVMSYNFTGGIPDYRCYIEGCDDGFDNMTETNLFTPSWLNNTIPWDETSPNKCTRYNHTWANINECQEHGSPTDTIEECDRWFYDKTLFSSTIVTEFDLTCANEWKQTFFSSIFMFGMLVGSAVLGSIADIIGRRLAFSLNVLVLATVTTCLAFSKTVATFSVLRFICGASAIGNFIIIYVWGMESVGKKYRVIVSLVYEMVFSCGSLVLGVVAYYVRDWKTLQLIISVPMFLLVGIYWTVPESTRWLISKKRFLEARQLIFKAAKTNKANVPKHLLIIPSDTLETGISVPSEKSSEGVVSMTENNKPINMNNSQKKESIMDVFRSPILLKRLAILFLTWMASLMAYYGITFSTTNLSDNFYLNYELTILVEFPASIVGCFMMNKFGRRSTLCGALVLSGIACLVTGLADSSTVQIIFSMIGKFFITLVIVAIFVFTSDLFPTPARMATLGLCSTSGRVGGILAPIIATIGRKIDPTAPFIIFAIANICVGMLCLFLPETKNSALPATVREAEDLEKYIFTCLQCRGTSKKTMENGTTEQFI